MIVAGDLNFGGPGTLPQGRFDTSYVVTDTFSRRQRPALDQVWRRVPALHQRELRRGHRACSTSRAWTRSWPARRTRSASRSASGGASSTSARVGLFVQDQVAVRDRLTLELGMRYEWHVTPTERDNRFVVFDARARLAGRASASTSTRSTSRTTGTSNRASASRGRSRRDGRTVLRAAYARAVDQPGTTAVRDTAGNPPFGVAADGDRRDSARQRDRHDATRRARTGHDRSAVPERVAALVERQPAAAARAGDWP